MGNYESAHARRHWLVSEPAFSEAESCAQGARPSAIDELIISWLEMDPSQFRVRPVVRL